MTEKSIQEKEVLEEKEMPVEEAEEKKSESFLTKRVSTLIGGLAIGGVTLVFLLIILIMWLAK